MSSKCMNIFIMLLYMKTQDILLNDYKNLLRRYYRLKRLTKLVHKKAEEALEKYHQVIKDEDSDQDCEFSPEPETDSNSSDSFSIDDSHSSHYLREITIRIPLRLNNDNIFHKK